MNSGQKTAVSLLVSVALFAGFVFSVYSSLFAKIETRFYEPERIAGEREQLKQSADFCNDYIQNLLVKTGEYAQNEAVLSYLSQTPSDSDVTERVKLSGELFLKLPALEGYRLLDKNARNLHYSSYSSDIVKQNGTTKVYKNYPDIEKIDGECSFALVSIPETDNTTKSKITFNSVKKQLNVSVPVFDKFNVFRGTFVFYIKTADLERELVKAGLVSIGESLSLVVSEDGLRAGFVTGLPNIGTEIFENPLLASWDASASGPDKIVVAEGDKNWVSLSDYSSPYVVFAEIYTSDYFELPEAARILILVCVFITLFLIIFLIFSFKIDDMVIIRSRIKKIQFAFVAEYLENKETVDWEQVSRQIEGRKDDLFRDVKKSLGRKGRKHENQVDALLNKSWDEILFAIGVRQAYENQISQKDNSAEIKKMLEEVLRNSELKVRAIEAPASAAPVQSAPAPVEVLDDVEALDEVEELDDVEALDEVEELDEVEALDEVEEFDEVEALDEVEELDDVEALDEVEELDDVEPLDEVEAVEEIDEAEPVEDVDAVEELDEVEELGEAEAVEELDEVEELGEAEAVEELTDAEPVEEVESVEEIEEAESVEELADSEPVEELDDVEELGEAETVEEFAATEPVEELDDVEETEALELLDDTETLEEVEEAEVVELLEEEVPEELSEEVSEELVSEVVKERDPVFSEVNSTFESDTHDSFATVENIFAEELRFGESYIEDVKFVEDSELEEQVAFNLFDPEFGENEELIPVEEPKYFSMAGFGLNNNNVSDLDSGNETIIETDGVYSISANVEFPNTGLDKEFKKLVDAVLR
ncbi:MAG: hypothetical protein MJ181_02460 [Treponema sp.]|nr:hypothetical protein [Treponema sp.]